MLISISIDSYFDSNFSFVTSEKVVLIKHSLNALLLFWISEGILIIVLDLTYLFGVYLNNLRVESIHV
jgi:hypothetical protein